MTLLVAVLVLLFVACVAGSAVYRHGRRSLVDVMAARMGPGEGDLVLELEVALGRDEIERLDRAIRGR
jgi:hypothetical protein